MEGRPLGSGGGAVLEELWGGPALGGFGTPQGRAGWLEEWAGPAMGGADG